MTIFEIGKGRFATGTIGKLATYVVLQKGKKVTGVRGRRPKLDKRFKKVAASAAVREAFKTALA